MAGFVDAVVGGGGLIQLPALFSFVPQGSAAALFGTNKLSSIAGTSMAAARYLRSVKLDWNALGPALLGAAIFSWLGAAAVSLLPRELAQPLVLVMLVAVAVATFRKKELGSVHAPRFGVGQQRWFGFLTGMTIGFYDGFFGPGTGAFLIFIFVRFFGYDFLHASASSKAVNLMTNFAALAFFLPVGAFFLSAALAMAACNVIGAVIGAQALVLSLRTGAFHYSNGQERCTVDESLRDDDAAAYGYASSGIKQTFPTVDLFMNMVNWLASDEDLISIRPKGLFGW